ncbi:Oidioi.mRNA.OKI2018_I69.XSR.g14297.t1.cds [Oikopleura dioica]|uniref:Oidioi.mRNA.OKI2018_I69.XSR.g14297.t1.cds n=1 Tax=Oikopleura dioica TaxID=34765 RepID=A0ABN7SFN1_OIKDI|nr:Oidioi.mRNA.OKI2018_I69.XSR.g14297.t1.cds [Oikopleura dioica]
MLGYLTPLIPFWKFLNSVEKSLAERQKKKMENPADKLMLLDPCVFAQMMVLLATFQVTLSRFPVFYYGLFYSELQNIVARLKLKLSDCSLEEDEEDSAEEILNSTQINQAVPDQKRVKKELSSAICVEKLSQGLEDL